MLEKTVSMGFRPAARMVSPDSGKGRVVKDGFVGDRVELTD